MKLTQSNSAALAIWKCSSCLNNLPSLNSHPYIAPSNPSTSPIDYLHYINDLRSTLKVPSKIPKAARLAAADALSRTINQALDSNTPEAWQRLFGFALLALGQMKTPKCNKQNSVSLSTSVKNSISLFLDTTSSCSPFSHSPSNRCSSTRSKRYL